MTQVSFIEPKMFGVAVAMTKVLGWLLFDTIVGAVACCWKKTDKRCITTWYKAKINRLDKS